MATTASSIMFAIGSTSGNQPEIRRLPETAAMTFKRGTPVMLVDGAVVEWDGTTLDGIYGIAMEAANDLAETGVPKLASQDEVPYQPDASSYATGSKMNDGRIAVELANDDSLFFGEVAADQTVDATFVGEEFGMTKDDDGHWHVDLDKTSTSGGSSATEAVLRIEKLDQFDPRGVWYKFLKRGVGTVSAP